MQQLTEDEKKTNKEARGLRSKFQAMGTCCAFGGTFFALREALHPENIVSSSGYTPAILGVGMSLTYLLWANDMQKPGNAVMYLTMMAGALNAICHSWPAEASSPEKTSFSLQ